MRAVRNATVHHAMQAILDGNRAEATRVLVQGVEYQAFLLGVAPGRTHAREPVKPRGDVVP